MKLKRERKAFPPPSLKKRGNGPSLGGGQLVWGARKEGDGDYRLLGEDSGGPDEWKRVRHRTVRQDRRRGQNWSSQGSDVCSIPLPPVTVHGLGGRKACRAPGVGNHTMPLIISKENLDMENYFTNIYLHWTLENVFCEDGVPSS